MTSTEDLSADRALLGRTSTAERVAGILRARISAGYFAPGERLTEDEITKALGVSRNTLREAFRLLTHERLLVHQLNQGMFVRKLDLVDVLDLYKVRKHVQCSVVRAVTGPPANLGALTEAVRLGERAIDERDWRGLGTANIQFHEALAAIADSPRIDELMRGVLAELRLVFHVMTDVRWFHEPYLRRNREILAALGDGDGLLAERLLHEYLDDAEQQLRDAYARAASSPTGELTGPGKPASQSTPD
ncbi:DNA-binding GntR family transcriptional regulator [Pseudonocardia eucalypti]|uniref:FCD domain-containing protein n=1 Tax=Pseudonocardia eucalypti TaxID=648755 RepID=UPI001615176A|nr:DNA-binding GntR family transcriptional regulator [Pseudonocardia eucalypti]